VIRVQGTSANTAACSHITVPVAPSATSDAVSVPTDTYERRRRPSVLSVEVQSDSRSDPGCVDGDAHGPELQTCIRRRWDTIMGSEVREKFETRTVQPVATCRQSSYVHEPAVVKLLLRIYGF